MVKFCFCKNKPDCVVVNMFGSCKMAQVRIPASGDNFRTVFLNTITPVHLAENRCGSLVEL